jgi:formamidopyrimidine-DNA glycosylase
MPELPEVETIKNELTPLVIGRTIETIEFLWSRTLRGDTPEELARKVAGRKITGLSRRGKYLVFLLTGGYLLTVHLKMTGSFLVAGRLDEPTKHTRAVIYLDNGQMLFFIDPRKFGRFQLVNKGGSFLDELGIEPLSPEFTTEYLHRLLTKRVSAPVKSILLDQKLIAGVGNLYADEALFLARIHPLRPGGSITLDEAGRLNHAIRRVLAEAIERKGASIANYFRPGGETGTAHDHFMVAHQLGKECPGCDGRVERIVVRGRGTYFCPKCQH